MPPDLEDTKWGVFYKVAATNPVDFFLCCFSLQRSYNATLQITHLFSRNGSVFLKSWIISNMQRSKDGSEEN